MLNISVFQSFPLAVFFLLLQFPTCVGSFWCWRALKNMCLHIFSLWFLLIVAPWKTPPFYSNCPVELARAESCYGNCINMQRIQFPYLIKLDKCTKLAPFSMVVFPLFCAQRFFKNPGKSESCSLRTPLAFLFLKLFFKYKIIKTCTALYKMKSNCNHSTDYMT